MVISNIMKNSSPRGHVLMNTEQNRKVRDNRSLEIGSCYIGGWGSTVKIGWSKLVLLVNKVERNKQLTDKKFAFKLLSAL